MENKEILCIWNDGFVCVAKSEEVGRTGITDYGMFLEVY